MNAVSTLLIALIATLLVITIVRLVGAIARDVLRSNHVRASLRDRLRLLRMNRMLARRNISLDEYLHGEPVSDVERSVRACEACQAQRQCDEVLSMGADRTCDFGFCPNDEAFTAWRARA